MQNILFVMKIEGLIKKPAVRLRIWGKIEENVPNNIQINNKDNKVLRKKQLLSWVEKNKVSQYRKKSKHWPSGFKWFSINFKCPENQKGTLL